jgi:hypothetical protein
VCCLATRDAVHWAGRCRDDALVVIFLAFEREAWRRAARHGKLWLWNMTMGRYAGVDKGNTIQRMKRMHAGSRSTRVLPTKYNQEFVRCTMKNDRL